MGVFNAVATWLDSILTHFGHGGASGYLIAIMTVGGIAGGALLPDIVARRDQRRGMLKVAVVVSAVAFAVMAGVHSPAVAGVVLFVAGFFLLAGLPVVLDWSELDAGPERAGAAAGFLLLAGNLGGVVLALIVQAVIGSPYLSLGVLVLAGLAGLELAHQLKPYGDQFPSFSELPAHGLSRTDVTALVERLAGAEEHRWRDGYASGAIYQ